MNDFIKEKLREEIMKEYQDSQPTSQISISLTYDQIAILNALSIRFSNEKEHVSRSSIVARFIHESLDGFLADFDNPNDRLRVAKLCDSEYVKLLEKLNESSDAVRCRNWEDTAKRMNDHELKDNADADA